ncbi:MAG: prephenate dehydrogenase [Planctomycetes bacterium]|nr:prephenate dehydrogenase [Planctomycetota bacterium]
MLFDTVAIVGVGLIGGSIGLAIKQRQLARRVVGVGRRQLTLRQARHLGAIDHGTLRLDRGVADAELTVLCTPVDLIARQAAEVAPHCPPGSILTDSGSTKLRIVQQLEGTLPDRVCFVGSHPLAGSEKRGVEEARPDLFEGRVCIVTQTQRTPVQPLKLVQQFWRALGARVVTMSPETHDRALAYTSHLPHLAAAALAVALPERYGDVVASGFRDTTRIAASDPQLWSAIFLENAGPLLEAVACYERGLTEFRLALENRDEQRLLDLWAESKAKRDAVTADGHAAPRAMRVPARHRRRRSRGGPG